MLRIAGVSLAAMVMLTACQSGSFSKQGAGNPATVSGASASNIPPMAKTRFSDVPLPQGIKEDMERSYVYESSTLQVGRMVYDVDERIINVAQFYINEAPRHGWELTSMLQAEGAQMTFEKPGRRMWVSVSSDGMMKKNSRLIINVVPDEASTQGRVQTLGAALPR